MATATIAEMIAIKKGVILIVYIVVYKVFQLTTKYILLIEIIKKAVSSCKSKNLKKIKI